MKRPRTVEIGGLKYKIKYVKPGSCKELRKEDTGAILQDKQKIWIDKDANDSVQLLTLIHEFLHGIAFQVYPTKSIEFREHFACAVADGLLQALQSAKLLKRRFD
jgi:hypothetical protein